MADSLPSWDETQPVQDSAPAFDQSAFLNAIAKKESQGNYKALGQPIGYGLSKGKRAIGKYQLTPETIDTIANHSNDPDVQSLSDLSDDDKTKTLLGNPQLQDKLAQGLLDFNRKKVGDDPDKLAFAWNQGVGNVKNFDPDHPYVQGFKKFYKPTRQIASDSAQTLPSWDETTDVNDGPTSTHFSQLESAGLGAVQGATLGFADEAEGAGRALYDKATGDDNGKNLEDLYKQYRDSARQRYHQAQQENPWSYGAGNVAGGVATAFVPGLNIAKAGSVGGALARGAAAGGLSGLGASESDTVAGDVGNTALGAGIGGVTGAAGYKLANFLTPEGMQASANTNAVKAMGAKVTPENLKVGQTMLENGALPLTGGAQAIADAAGEGQQEIEKQAIPILTKAKEVIDTSGGKVLDGVPDLGSKITELTDQFNSNFVGSNKDQVLGEVNKLASSWYDDLTKVEDNPVALRRFRGLLDDEIKTMDPNAFTPGAVLDPSVKYLLDLRQTVNDHLGQVIDAASENMGGQYSQLMQKYSQFIKAQGMASKLAIKDATKSSGPKIRDIAALSGAAVLKSKAMAGADLALMGAEKLTGNPASRLAQIAAARTQNAVANSSIGQGALAVGNAATNLTTKAVTTSGVQSGIQSIYNTSSDKLKEIADHFQQQPNTQYMGQALAEAISKQDEDAKNKVLFAMEQRPDTRAQLRQLIEAQEDKNEESELFGLGGT